jgi:uncharacterized protein (DUF1330 family)
MAHHAIFDVTITDLEKYKEYMLKAAMQSFYESSEYRGLKALRESCSRANLVSVEGV